MSLDNIYKDEFIC